MNTLDLLTKLEALGVALRSEDGRLLYRPKDAVPAELRAEMRIRKEEIIGWLSWPVETSEPRSRHHAHSGLRAGQEVSTPRGRGRSVAVLPEFVAVKLFNSPRNLSYFMPCELSYQGHDLGDKP